MAHTQEPWGVNDLAANNADVYLTGLDGTKSPLGYIVQTAIKPIAAMIEIKADARLIAAAPDLLAALESIIDDLVGGIQDTIENGGSEAWIAEANTRLNAARAAIAKAKGEA